MTDLERLELTGTVAELERRTLRAVPIDVTPPAVNWGGLAHCVCCPVVLRFVDRWRWRFGAGLPRRPIQQRFHCSCCSRLRAVHPVRSELPRRWR